eukprot:6085347-Amphidinium_carterae.2
MKEVCYKYFEKLRDLRDEWRAQQIEKDEKKLEAKNKREEERRQAEKRKRDEEAQRQTESITAKAPSTSASAAASSTPARPATPTRPTRPAPVPKGEQALLEEAPGGKSTPPMPSKPAQSPRLRLDKDNFHMNTVKKADAFYEKKIIQEMMQRSYIRFHPTTGYHQATQEIRQFYNGFEIYNFENRFNPQKANQRGRGEAYYTTAATFTQLPLRTKLL